MEDVESIFGSVNSSAGEPPPGHLSSPPTTGEAAPLPPGPALENMIADGLGGDSAVPIDRGWHPFHGPECDSCITLGIMTHSGERFMTTLSLHGSAEILHHAILLLYEFTDIISEDKFIAYLSSMDAESVGRFLANYRNSRLLDGYKILYDDCRPLYDVPFTQLDNSDGHTITELRELHSTPDVTSVHEKSMDALHVINTRPNKPDPNPTKDAESVEEFFANYRNFCVLDGDEILYDDCRPLYDVPFTQLDNSDRHSTLEVRELHSTTDITLVGDKAIDAFQVVNTGPNEPDPNPTMDVESTGAESVGEFHQNYRNFCALDGDEILHDDCRPLDDVPFTQLDNSDRHSTLEVREHHSTPDIMLVGDKAMDAFQVVNTGPNEPDPNPTMDVESMGAESVGGFLQNYRKLCVLDGDEILYDDCRPLDDVPFTQLDNSDRHSTLEVRELHSTPDITLVGDKAMDAFQIVNTGPNEPDPNPTMDVESTGAESVGGFLQNYRNFCALDGDEILYNDCRPLDDVPFTQLDNSDRHSTLEVRELHSTPDITLVGDKDMDAFQVVNIGPNEPDPNPTKDVESMGAESVGGFLQNYRNFHVHDAYKILSDDCQLLYDVNFTQLDTSDGHTILKGRQFHSTPDFALVGDRSMNVLHVANTAPNEPDPNPFKDVESVGGFLRNYRNCRVLDACKILYDDCVPVYDLRCSQVDNSYGHTILKAREFNSTPDITLAGDKSMDVFHVANTRPNEHEFNLIKAPHLEIYPTEETIYLASHQYTNEMHQFHSFMSAEGPSKMEEDGGERIQTFGISYQRQRIMKMTFSDVSQYFNLPMNQAAQKLQICPSALKKVCRRFNINRWPYRKVASEKRWNVVFNITDNTPPNTVHDHSMDTGL